MKIQEILKAVAAIVIAQSAGLIGSLFTMSAIDGWYRTINKPSFNPPDFVFGPVWTTLYAMMGIASYLIWRKGIRRPEVRLALILYAGQLVLNAWWSIVFFGFQSPEGALIVIVALWLMIVATIVAFARVLALAAWLLVPYLLWCSFAAYLNYSIWLLN